MLENLKSRIANLNIEFSWDEDVELALSEKGFDEIYGARPLRREIQSKIEDALSEKILDGTIKNGDKVTCVFEDGKFDFK